MKNRYAQRLLVLGTLLASIGCRTQRPCAGAPAGIAVGYVIIHVTSGVEKRPIEGVKIALLSDGEGNPSAWDTTAKLGRPGDRLTTDSAGLVQFEWPCAERFIVVGSLDNQDALGRYYLQEPLRPNERRELWCELCLTEAQAK